MFNVMYTFPEIFLVLVVLLFTVYSFQYTVKQENTVAQPILINN